MNKGARILRASEMLHSLYLEQAHGGFNEYPQFCEEWLRYNLAGFSESLLKKLVHDVERASQLGITRRNPTITPLRGK